MTMHYRHDSKPLATLTEEELAEAYGGQTNFLGGMTLRAPYSADFGDEDLEDEPPTIEDMEEPEPLDEEEWDDELEDGEEPEEFDEDWDEDDD